MNSKLIYVADVQEARRRTDQWYRDNPASWAGAPRFGLLCASRDAALAASLAQRGNHQDVLFVFDPATGAGFYPSTSHERGYWRDGGAWPGHREYVPGPIREYLAVPNLAARTPETIFCAARTAAAPIPE